MPRPHPLSENGGRHTQSGHKTDTNHIQPSGLYTCIQPCGIQAGHWLAWIPARCIVHLRNISVARQHGMGFQHPVDVLYVYIRTAVSDCVLQVHDVSGHVF